MKIDYNWDIKEWPVQTHIRSKTMAEHIEKIKCLFGDELSPWIKITTTTLPEKVKAYFINYRNQNGVKMVGLAFFNSSGKWAIDNKYVEPDGYMPIPPIPEN